MNKEGDYKNVQVTFIQSLQLRIDVYDIFLWAPFNVW